MRGLFPIVLALSVAMAWGQSPAPSVKSTEAVIEIEDALTLARRYLAENRIYAPHFIVISAILREQSTGQDPYWEITYQKKRAATQTQTTIRLKVKMDKTVERLDQNAATSAK